ncbi:2-C-methyl-D-erythritol 2,4-cyclodiphosphate synthase [Sporobacter termitidis DSM 10068]|uniref:2-C-methyl-D-erythritol 2,4-cyclodiphosphate synthase n=1 Tax=Sporobacter termitidis DSM 10068 TaxID=1123282 RepID=A0A1M5TIX8_9FIRM|nr:2-C-methyl-D-erythritol 2,4-cyclodiphosphate synthase [Sporobacter termitidis]SHH50600.1 2-C-methyl-D-erythritol 2,4-cyclodiphosphate synthase [Sporobacter termitidis DSM 10068]
MRIGHGYDVHRLKTGRPCILCGVLIPSDFGPDGHSDADVPVHALMDALLGALALGDIGKYFPDSDEKYKDADSVGLLKIVYGDIQAKGYKLSNADMTIVAQNPKLSPHIADMRRNIAAALGCGVEQISVKATTEEKMGFTGEGLGISAHAVVLLEKI